jgi:hypothetical protein
VITYFYSTDSRSSTDTLVSLIARLKIKLPHDPLI